MKYRIALAQIDSRLGGRDANLKHMLDWTRQAQEQHADLVIFPELALTGYYVKDLVAEVAVQPQPDDPYMGPLLEASRLIDLVVGFVEAGPRSQYYITAAYLSGGRVAHLHRKVYLPTYRLFDDNRFFAPGGTLRAFDTRLGRMGLMICEDAWHLSTPYVLWMDGAEWLIDIAASPAYGMAAPRTPPGATSANAFLQTYAELMTTFVFYCNRVGVEDGIQFWGGSCILAPGGETIAQAPQFQEALTVADVDTDILRRARLKLPTLRDEQRELVRHELGRISKQALDT